MKSAKKLLVPFLVMALSACSGSGKFTGKWHMAKGIGDHDRIIVIAQKGDHYDLYSEQTPHEVLSFTYDKGHDVLMANDRYDIIDIKYHDDTHHLTMGSRGSANMLELEKL